MKIHAISIILALLSMNAGAWNLFGPKNFDECVLENMKGVTSDTAATTIYAACDSKFSEKSEKKCSMRLLTSSELSKITSKGSFTNIGSPYFSASFYNGNANVSIDAATIAISATNIKPPQEYTLTFLSPIAPKSSGTAGVTIQTAPTPNKWGWDVQLKTCSK